MSVGPAACTTPVGQIKDVSYRLLNPPSLNHFWTRQVILFRAKRYLALVYCVGSEDQGVGSSKSILYSGAGLLHAGGNAKKKYQEIYTYLKIFCVLCANCIVLRSVCVMIYVKAMLP